MKCFKCGSELITDEKNIYEFVCPNCNNYAISRTAINIIPNTLDNSWEGILENYVSVHLNDKKNY